MIQFGTINFRRTFKNYFGQFARIEKKKKTSRERPKSAPYPRLKNSERTSKFPSFGELGLLLWKIFFWKKVSQCRKKLKGRTLWDFSTSILLQNSKKLKGGPFRGEKFLKKVAQCRKNLKGGGPFGLVRYFMLRGKPFWFSSLGQRVHFGVFWIL